MKKYFTIILSIFSLLSCTNEEQEVKPTFDRGFVEVEVNGEYKDFSSKNHTYQYKIDYVDSGWAHTARIDVVPVWEYDQISIICLFGEDGKTITNFKVHYTDMFVRESGYSVGDIYLYSDQENPLIFSNVYQDNEYVYGEFEGALTLKPYEDKSIDFKNGKFKIPLFRVEKDSKW